MALPTPLRLAKDLLQGKGLVPHPIHVAINHVPLGLWEGSIIFDFMSRRRGSPALSEGGYYLNLFGIASAVPTALTGLAEWWDIPIDHPSWKTATAHAVLNDVALALAVYNWWSRRERRHFEPDTTNLVASGALGAVLGLSGYLGGVVAHEYGYGTHRQGSSIAKQQDTLVGPQPADSDQGVRLSTASAVESFDSWAGVADGELADRDDALETELGDASHERESGGTGI